MEFDPSAYLSVLDPGNRYNISQLTGGFINFTFERRRQLMVMGPGDSPIIVH